MAEDHDVEGSKGTFRNLEKLCFSGPHKPSVYEEVPSKQAFRKSLSKRKKLLNKEPFRNLEKLCFRAHKPSVYKEVLSKKDLPTQKKKMIRKSLPSQKSQII